jgi:putative SOS response-associated peptidase YedK
MHLACDALRVFAGKPLMLAGIWDYSYVKGDTVASFAILTDEPNELVAPYHDRTRKNGSTASAPS